MENFIQRKMNQLRPNKQTWSLSECAADKITITISLRGNNVVEFLSHSERLAIGVKEF